MLIIQLRLCLLLIALCVASVIHAAPDIEILKNSLVTVVVKSGEIQHQSVGIALGNEQVLVVRPEKKRNLQFSIKPWSSNAVLLATLSEKDAEMDQTPLMILHVPGLQLNAAKFLSSDPVAGLSAYTPIAREGTQGDYEIKRGALANILEFQPLTGLLFKRPKGPILRLVSHNVLVTATRFGSPVVNECGQVVAVSIADPRLDKAQRAKDPNNAMTAVLATQIVQWLQDIEIEGNVANEVCLGAEQQAQQAQQQAQQAQQQAQEAQQQAQEAEAKVLAAEENVTNAEQALREALSKATTNDEQKAAAQQALQQAKTALEKADQNAQVAQVEITRIKEYAAQQRSLLFEKIKLYGGISVAGLLFILLLWLLSNRKKTIQIKSERERVVEAEYKAQKAIAENEIRQAPFDCILEGQDADGKRHLLKLHKTALADADGVILGRNPRNATFVIGHEEISREHARLSVDNNMLYAHDLGSANGTRVDGKTLSAQDSAQLVDGATLDMGPIRFKVKLVFDD